MNAMILLFVNGLFKTGSTLEYSIGAIAALIILGYLVFALLRPEKF